MLYWWVHHRYTICLLLPHPSQYAFPGCLLSMQCPSWTTPQSHCPLCVLAENPVLPWYLQKRPCLHYRQYSNTATAFGGRHFLQQWKGFFPHQCGNPPLPIVELNWQNNSSFDLAKSTLRVRVGIKYRGLGVWIFHTPEHCSYINLTFKCRPGQSTWLGKSMSQIFSCYKSAWFHWGQWSYTVLGQCISFKKF